MYKVVFRNKYVFILLTMFLVQLFLVFYQSNIPRGSDQFWYIVDAESVAKETFTTNNIFPNSISDDGNVLRPFVQNRPIVYIAGYLVKIGFNSLIAYKIINIVSYLTILSLLFFSLRYLKFNIEITIGALCLLVASPLIIFSLFNALTNLFDAALFSMFIFSIFIFFNRNLNSIGHFIFLIFLALLYFLLITQRTDFIIYTWATILVLTFIGLKNKTFNIYKILFLIVLVVLIHLMVVASNCLPSHLAGDVPKYGVLLTGVNPYFHNMVSYFAENSDFNTLTIMEILKVKISLFFKSIFSPFNFLSFLYLFLLFIPVYFKSHTFNKIKPFEILFIVLGLLNFAVLFGFQFQYRYSIFLIAPSIFVIYNLFKEKILLLNINRFLIPLSLLVFFVFNYSTFNKLTAESAQSHSMLIQVKELNISRDSKVAVIYNGGSSLIWSWLLKDVREVHYLLPNEMQETPNDLFDIKVYTESTFKSRDKLPDESNYYKFGDYYVQLSELDDLKD